MKPRLSALVLLLVAGLVPTIAAANPVHLRFTHSTDSVFVFRADSASVWWHPAGAELTQLDVFYDAAHPGAANNYWSIRVNSEIGGFTIRRPFGTLDIQPFWLSFDYYRMDAGVFESFSFSAAFATPLDLTGSLPPVQPRLADPGPYWGPTSWQIDAGSSFFPAPHFAEGYGVGQFTTVIATPEPATYALGAFLLLAGAACVRRHRSTPGALAAG